MHNPLAQSSGQTTNIVPSHASHGRARRLTGTISRCHLHVAALPVFKVDRDRTTVGSGLAYMGARRRPGNLAAYLFVAEMTHNAPGPRCRSRGSLRRSPHTGRRRQAEYCVAYSAAGALQLTLARPVTDAVGVLAAWSHRGTPACRARHRARVLHDLPEDNPDIFSPFHIGIAQVLARAAAAGITVTAESTRSAGSTSPTGSTPPASSTRCGGPTAVGRCSALGLCQRRLRHRRVAARARGSVVWQQPLLTAT